MLAQVDEHRVGLPGHKTRDAPHTSRSTPVMVGGAPRIFSLPGLNVFAFFLGQNHVALGPCAVTNGTSRACVAAATVWDSECEGRPPARSVFFGRDAQADPWDEV
jgi:hypothetical protein